MTIIDSWHEIHTDSHTVAHTSTRTHTHITYLISTQMIPFKMQMRIEHDLVLSGWISLFR